MADIRVGEFNTTSIEDKTSGADLLVNSNGSINTQEQPAFKAEAKKFYWASYAFNLVNGGEKMALYFRNPSGSGKIIRIVDLTLTLANTVSTMAITRLYVNPTVSANGTAQSASPAYVGGSQAAAVGLVTSGPTVSANGTLYLTEHVSGGALAVSTVSDLAECLILAAGNSVLLTGDPDGTNRNLLITLTWVEE